MWYIDWIDGTVPPQKSWVEKERMHAICPYCGQENIIKDAIMVYPIEGVRREVFVEKSCPHMQWGKSPFDGRLIIRFRR